MNSTTATNQYRLETQVIRTGEWVTSGYYMTAAQAQRDAATIFARRQARIINIKVAA